jgi:hypothetical protein
MSRMTLPWLLVVLLAGAAAACGASGSTSSSGGASSQTATAKSRVHCGMRACHNGQLSSDGQRAGK